MASHNPQHTFSLPGELWGVTAFFNPSNNPLSLQNLIAFSRQIRRQGLKLLIVELAFDDAPFEVQEHFADYVLQRRCNTLLWQKERLLNLGIDFLPDSCDKVVWLDGDILFENDLWVTEVAQLLESVSVVQPFETAYWLPRGAQTASQNLTRGVGEKQFLPGMAFTMANRQDRRWALADYFEHGHTGFAWAARRTLLQTHHLYDRHILGGGDMVIAHSLYGDRDFWRGRNYYCRFLTKKELAAIAEWGRSLYADVGDSIYYIPGRVLHLWHGSISSRNYLERLRILQENDYDPTSDIILDKQGCWNWNSHKPNLHRQVGEYFASRSTPPVS